VSTSLFHLDTRPNGSSIIAVHGLNPRSKPDDGHAWDTWRKPEGPSSRLWLRDDLPAKAPEARIFLYEYNSKLIYGGEKALFIQKADDFLEDIRIQRKKVNKLACMKYTFVDLSRFYIAPLSSSAIAWVVS
jgi:hypothetical protein